MKLKRDHPSPNHDPQPIAVEFLVLHYTAASLPNTLAIFNDPQRKVSSHLVIDVNGDVYETVRCWDGMAYGAWHAGKSRWHDGTKEWVDLNHAAIGIEIVNLNGQVFPFTEAQYESLSFIVKHLQSLYPALQRAERVLGHEHIASFRGKADPGRCFDWPRFFRTCYPEQRAPDRTSVCPESFATALALFKDCVPPDPQQAARYWSALSSLTETAVAILKSSPREA